MAAEEMFVKSIHIHSLYNILQQTLGGNTLNKVQFYLVPNPNEMDHVRCCV